MIDTTFDVCSLDRRLIKWEDHIHDLSPVQQVGDMYFKREDFFAPLGYGNINGSKLRVCIWLISEAVKAGAKGVIHGAVTGSPQHPMVATICKHFGIPCVDVVGSKDIEKHKNLAIAKQMGATFEFCDVGYAKTLEANAYRLAKEKYKGYFVLETNITVNEGRNSAERIRTFHGVGAEQAKNIPDHIETIMIPAGSCNSVVGVLMGIPFFRPKNLKKIVTFGIGNYGSKDPDFIRRRLELIDWAPGLPSNYVFPFKKDGVLSFTSDASPYIIEHHDINGSGFCQYSDLMPYTHESIEFHPRYEGKIWNYMKKYPKKFEQYMNPKTMFWIVGGSVNI